MKTLFFILTILISFQAFSAPKVPELTGPVVDQAGVLSKEDVQRLQSEIRRVYKLGEGPQINILIMSSLEGTTAEEYANKVFTAWGLGEKKRDDGVLFLMSVKDHRMRIEVGQGLEGSLTDAHSKEILISLRDDFKRNQFGHGVSKGLAQIVAVVSRPEAVQMPVEVKAASQTPEPRINAIENLKGYSSLLVFIVAIAGLILPIYKVKTNQDAYNKSLKINADLDNVLTKYRNQGSISKQTKDLQEKMIQTGLENKTLLKEVYEMTTAKKSSPQGVLDGLKEQKRNLTKELDQARSETVRYQLIIKRGKA